MKSKAKDSNYAAFNTRFVSVLIDRGDGTVHVAQPGLPETDPTHLRDAAPPDFKALCLFAKHQALQQRI